jgi:hypothetical protein
LAKGTSNLVQLKQVSNTNMGGIFEINEKVSLKVNLSNQSISVALNKEHILIADNLMFENSNIGLDLDSCKFKQKKCQASLYSGDSLVGTLYFMIK